MTFERQRGRTDKHDLTLAVASGAQIRWQTAKEVAYRLGVQAWTVWHWGKCGYIRVKRVPGCFLYAAAGIPRLYRNHFKLTPANRREIQLHYGKTKAKTLASRFCVGKSTIYNIWQDRSQPKTQIYRQPKSQAESRLNAT